MLWQDVCLFAQKLKRRKPLEPRTGPEGRLSPCLSTLDVVVLGVSGTLGVGVYVLVGDVAKDKAGPATVLCFLAAALPTVLSGLCYAEFGARVPGPGSAYLYSYVTVGQLLAFVTGWTLILSYVIGAAIAARAWSSAVDGLTGNLISQALQGCLSLHVPHILAKHPDFLALGLVLVFTGLLAWGVSDTALVAKLLTGVNLLALSCILVCGFIKGDPHNWRLAQPDHVATAGPNGSSSSAGALGAGGFVPFGLDGVLRGAAPCFYALAGFDRVTAAGEEARRPRRSVPLGVLLSLLVCVGAALGASSVLTLLVPYHRIRADAPWPEALAHVGWAPARLAVAGGALCALASSLLGALFPTPRVVHAMAEDGLLLRRLARIHARTRTPVMATVVSGVTAASMAFLLEIGDLVDLTTLGTMLAYSVVAVSVLVLRYQPDQTVSQNEDMEVEKIEMNPVPEAASLDSIPESRLSKTLKSLCGPVTAAPTRKSGRVVCACASLLVILLRILCLLLAQWPGQLLSGDPAVTTIGGLLLAGIIGATFIIWRQPQNATPLHFKVPALPVLPLLSILLNVYLMMQMATGAWARFGVWMGIGLVIYFGYGIRNSLEKTEQQQPASSSQTP